MRGQDFMQTRTFHVPLILSIEADHPEIALTEAERITAAIAGEDRHLKVEPVVPAPWDQIPTFTMPKARIAGA